MATTRKRVVVYLTPKNEAVFNGLVKDQELGESEAVNIIIKSYVQSLTQDQRLAYISKARSKNQF